MWEYRKGKACVCPRERRSAFGASHFSHLGFMAGKTWDPVEGLKCLSLPKPRDNSELFLASVKSSGLTWGLGGKEPPDRPHRATMGLWRVRDRSHRVWGPSSLLLSSLEGRGGRRHFPLHGHFPFGPRKRHGKMELCSGVQ